MNNICTYSALLIVAVSCLLDHYKENVIDIITHYMLKYEL